MKVVTDKRMEKLAEQKGWMLARINGSHHVFTKEGRIERAVIPIHTILRPACIWSDPDAAYASSLHGHF